MGTMIYLDHCATTPLDPRVRSAMDAVRDQKWGNPSSVHAPGRRARALISEARSRIAQTLGAAPAEIVFTASASEANNLVLKGLALFGRPGPFRIVVSAFEHDSVRYCVHYLAERLEWVDITEVRPDEGGIVDPGAIDRACAKGASLVSVMAVNNETGTIQPIREIAEIAHRHGALFHTDAVQAMGRVEVSPAEIGCDLLTASSHKIYGPPGVGMMYVRNGVRLDSLVHGGHQEKGRRAGTEFLEGIVGFAEAVILAAESKEEDNAHLGDLEETFLDRLSQKGAPFQVNGSTADKVPGVINVSLRDVAGHDLVIGMDLAGFAISAGAACSSGVIEPSHVLQSMGLEPWRIESGVRISFGRANTREEVVQAADALSDLRERLIAEASPVTEKAL